ncbi:doublesex- and mab-3-related transcription factor A2-like [Adelges cooleyi]|uniref:doublesex- and mab-3-related transcription factor A2-like n=1 Tax=Adelges cooleyi TaxID=133065 RepID=UPI00217FCD64|nr:doublesex- and mab-3-related transcription factor A2-like [Adelges cooleyi]
MPKIEKSGRVLYELPPKQQQHGGGGDKHDSVVSAVTVSLSAGSGGRKEKKRLCTNCKNHGLAKIWKKHKRYCMYRDCQCAKCQKTAATRKNCALQTAKRRAKQEDEQREHELQMNPGSFLDERPVPHPIPQPHASESAASSTFRSVGQLSVSSVAAVSSTKASSSRTSDYDDSSSIDIGGGGGSTGGGGGIGGGGRVISHADPISHYVDIDADSRPDMAMSDPIEDIGSVLKELINRTKEFQNLDAFRLFILQHNTFDVDKATKLIKRGERKQLKIRFKLILQFLTQRIVILSRL